VSPQPKIQMIKVRGSCRSVVGASASYPLFTKSLVQVLSDNVEKMRWCPIICDPHVLSLMKRNMFQKFLKMMGTAPVSLVGKTTAPKSWSPEMRSQTLTHSYFSRHWFLNICWLGRFCSFKEVLYSHRAQNSFF
jgi:hypothetical protein